MFFIIKWGLVLIALGYIATKLYPYGLKVYNFIKEKFFNEK
jgi:hypothetical protein